MSVALVNSEQDYLTWTSGGGIPQIDSFTFIGWFKPNFGSGTTPNFFSIGETGVAGRSIYQDESQFLIWAGSAGTGQGSVADDTWYCIAWRGNGTELKGYRKLSDATSFTTWTENQGSGTLTEDNVSVGRWINNTSHWNGEIRAVKGWNSALTDQEIEDESRQFAPVKTSGLLWYVGLSNSSDTSDSSGNGNNPTVVGLANGATDPTLPAGGTTQDLAADAVASATAAAQLAVAKAMGGAATGTGAATADILLLKALLAAASGQALAAGDLALAKLLAGAVAASALATGELQGVAVITTPPLKNNTGTVLASESGATVHVYLASTGAHVVTKTGQTTNGSGVMSITDALLVASTAYRIVIVLASGAEGLETLTAA